MKNADQVQVHSPQLADRLLLSILALDISEPSMPKRSPTTPHCDCAEANRRHLGRMFKPSNRALTETNAFDMVPTVLQAGSSDLCAFCGYTTCFVAEKAITGHQRAGTYDECAKLARLRRSQAVVGRCLETGNEVHFSSALDAYNAGFGSVNYAIKKRDGRLKGYHWRLA